MNEEAFSGRITQKNKFLSSSTGVEPMTFQNTFGHSNHLAMEDSWRERSYTRFLCMTHACPAISVGIYYLDDKNMEISVVIFRYYSILMTLIFNIIKLNRTG